MMAACVAPSGSTASTSSPTVEALLCDGCRCPIGSVWDVLPAEERAPAWRDQVYSYELDLFANGAPPIQAYSATNPSKRRFDLLRLAPYVTVRQQQQPQQSTPSAFTDEVKGDGNPAAKDELEQKTVDPRVLVGNTAQTRAPAFAVCDTAEYSPEHSFFTGYAWCFCHCGNCGAFLGWGFAAEERLRAAAAARTRAREDATQSDEEGETAKTSSRRRVDDATGTADSRTAPTAASLHTASASASSSSATRSEEDGEDGGGDDDASEDTEEEETSQASASGVAPDFIGIIITHCTGSPNYPVASLAQEVEWQAWRMRRRQRVEAISKEIRYLLKRVDDGRHAHGVYYAYEAVVRNMFATAPPSAHPVVGEDDVPPQLLEVLEVARAAVARQHLRQRNTARAREAAEAAAEDSSSDRDGDGSGEENRGSTAAPSTEPADS